MARSRQIVLGALVALGCRATTGRPHFTPFPEAEVAELGFGLVDRAETVMRLTDTVTAYFAADSLALRSIKRFDGYFESDWLDSTTARPTGRAPLGPGVVRVRGWIDPSKPGFARVEVETVYIPLADPSLPARELEAPVPITHPVYRRVAATLGRLKERYGAPVEDSATAGRPIRPGGRPPIPDSAAARPDSSRAPRDTTKTKPDTTAAG